MALIVGMGYLLWPLGSRRWAVATDHEAVEKKQAFLAASRTHAPSPAEPLPNVVLILADDLPPSEVGIYGERELRLTPNIDSIGGDGVLFTDASCTSAICAPSRAALLTGRYQQRYGFEMQPHDRYARTRLEYLAFRYIVNTEPMVPLRPGPIPRRRDLRDQGLPAAELTIAELLRSRGYATAALGKWHLGYDLRFSPLERGFDEHWGFYEAFSLYAPTDDPDVVNTPIDDFSDRHMWSRGRDGASAIVHNDREVTEEEYLTSAIADRAAAYIDRNAEAEQPFFLYVPFSAPHTPLQAPREEWDQLSHVSNPLHRTYYAMVAALNVAVGRILDALEQNQIADHTLVIFASDNGGVAVPMMIRYPGQIPPGSVYRSPVSLLDLFATVEAATRRPGATYLRTKRSSGAGTLSTPPAAAPGSCCTTPIVIWRASSTWTRIRGSRKTGRRRGRTWFRISARSWGCGKSSSNPQRGPR